VPPGVPPLPVAPVPVDTTPPEPPRATTRAPKLESPPGMPSPPETPSPPAPTVTVTVDGRMSADNQDSAYSPPPPPRPADRSELDVAAAPPPAPPPAWHTTRTIRSPG